MCRPSPGAQDAMSARRWSGVLVLLAAAGLGGCAVVETMRKCGAGCPGDAALTAAVQARIGEHTALLAPNRVFVSSRDGIVYLSGQVATDAQRLDAVDVARATPRVTRVVDTIALEYTGR
jgi:osmotically-inducible protein OsmY